MDHKGTKRMDTDRLVLRQFIKVNVYVYSDGIERFGEIERVDIGTWFLPFR